MTATITPPRPPAPPAPPTPERRLDGVVLEGVSWETYERLREDLDSADQHVQIVYNGGRMVVMAPLGDHDRDKRLIGRMVEMLSAELDIPIASFGSTTWKRKELGKGVEPDEAYYVQREPLVGDRKLLDLKQDPPPDLVVEVEGTLSPVEKFPVYATLGVPEIWHYDGKTLACLHLRGGRYEPAEHSLAFPFLRPGELVRFVAMIPTEREHGMMRAFRAWIQAFRPKS